MGLDMSDVPFLEPRPWFVLLEWILVGRGCQNRVVRLALRLAPKLVRPGCRGNRPTTRRLCGED